MSNRIKSLLIALILLSGILVFLSYQKDPVLEDQLIRYQLEIDRNRHEIDSLLKRQDQLKRELKEDSIQSEKEKKKYQYRIANLKQELEKKRPEITVIADSFPQLKEFINLQDSIITTQAARIDTLESDKARQWKTFNQILTASEEKYKAQVEINDHMNSIVQIERKKNKRITKQNIGLKIGLGVVATILVIKN